MGNQETVAQSREHLLDAGYSHPAKPEDRLTELVACVLDICAPLASELFSAFGLTPCERYKVFTQEQVTNASRPDMRVEGLTADGAPRAQLWLEHKLDARWQPDQVKRYTAARAAAPGNGKVVCVVKTPPDFECEFVTWQRFAELCERAGRGWADTSWVERALEPDAPAQWRLLAELVWYLEERERLAVVQPLDADKLAVFAAASNALRTLETLLETAADHVSGFTHDGPGDDGDGDAYTVSFDPPTGSWLEDFPNYAYPDLIVSARDYWSPEHLNAPVFGAGISLHNKKVFAQLSANAQWVDALLKRGYACEVWADWARIYRTIPATDVLGFGDSLEDQAVGLAKWAKLSMEEVIAVNPSHYSGEEPSEAQPRSAKR